MTVTRVSGQSSETIRQFYQDFGLVGMVRFLSCLEAHREVGRVYATTSHLALGLGFEDTPFRHVLWVNPVVADEQSPGSSDWSTIVTEFEVDERDSNRDWGATLRSEVVATPEACADLVVTTLLRRLKRIEP